ncbi:Golgi apyrase [Onygenales sp. PD_12]|nr:Golgi apyrase [Onygenales sp. PD_12]
MGIWRYAVILDAGSSGTRVHVYRWPDSVKARKSASAKELVLLPEVITKDNWTKKIHPGISTFNQNPKDVGLEHLRPLIHHALEIIPEEDVPDTPIFLLATAGMRLLPNSEQKAILSNVCAYIRENTDLLMPDCGQHVQVIEGNTEGLYGWIATNYLMGGFDDRKAHDHGKGHHTYGFLDMGGASAQIAFAPNATEAEKHANDLTLMRLRNINGQSSEYRVFVTSWLGFGARQARSRYVKALLEAAGNEKNRKRPDPCLPSGLRTTLDGSILPSEGAVSGTDPYLVGTGKFEDCLRQTFPLLDKDAPCPDEPCLLNGVHVPAIDFDVNHFIGISEYWHTTHEIFEMAHKDKAYDFNTYQKRVKEFCGQPWDTIKEGVVDHKWGKKVDQETAYEVCFKASWLINVLHDGIGIPRVGIENTLGSGHNGTKEVLAHGKEKGFLDAFQAVNKIDSTEVSWTLGKAVLYASSQVPPLKNGLPVGFGSNVAGVPDDFQYPGPQLLQLPRPTVPHNETESDHWHDTLFKGDTPRRIPGIFLFLFIVAFAVFFLCGRERRKRLYRKMTGRPSSRGGISTYHHRRKVFFANKFPFFRRGSHHVAYERVLEDGARDFELGGMSSDEETNFGNNNNKSSPTMMKNGMVLDHNNSSSSLYSNVGHMDRNGLAVRTESRERLAPLALGPTNNGRRSRAASPVRHKTSGSSPFLDD